jgi:hypothetical protein
VDTIQPVLIGVPSDTIVACNEVPPMPLVIAWDECNCAQISFEEIVDTTAACQDGNEIIRIWTAMDCCGNITQAQQVITIVDEEGPIMMPANYLIAGIENGDTLLYDCNGEGIPSWIDDLTEDDVFAMDECSDVAMVYDLHEIHSTNKCAFYGYKEKHTMQWVAEDACGNLSTWGFQVHLIDTVYPIIQEFPDTICVEDLEKVELIAYDECGTALIYHYDDVEDGLCGLEVTRNYEVSDECGNTVTFSKFIYIQPDEGPELTFTNEQLLELELGEPAFVDCDMSSETSMTGFSSADVEVSDNCALGVTVSFEETMVETYSDCVETGWKYGIDAIWTATDLCGATASLTVRVILLDREEPVLVDFKEELYMECGQDIPAIIVER